MKWKVREAFGREREREREKERGGGAYVTYVHVLDLFWDFCEYGGQRILLTPRSSTTLFIFVAKFTSTAFLRTDFLTGGTSIALL